MPKFVLPKTLQKKGAQVIADRYAFVDGEMAVSKADAPLLERILVRFHGCELVADEPKKQAESVDGDQTLKSSATKGETPKTPVVTK